MIYMGSHIRVFMTIIYMPHASAKIIEKKQKKKMKNCAQKNFTTETVINGRAIKWSLKTVELKTVTVIYILQNNYYRLTLLLLHTICCYYIHFKN